MKLLKEPIHIALNANSAELRKFGFVFSFLLIALFFLFIPWLRHGGFGPLPVLYTGLALFVGAVLFPPALRPVFFVASIVGYVLGAVNNRLLLSLIFFLILLPISTLMRLVSKVDAMGKRFDPSVASYRVSCLGRDMVKNKEKVF